MLARRSIVRTAAPAGDGRLRRSSSRSSCSRSTRGGLQAATEIPGFPTDDYLDFALARAVHAGAGCSPSAAPAPTWRSDIRTGFLDRLSLTPMQGAALLLGHLAGIAVLAVMQGTVFLLVGLHRRRVVRGGHRRRRS